MCSSACEEGPGWRQRPGVPQGSRPGSGAGERLYLYARVVVDGHLFRTDPHVLHQHEFDGGRHGHEGMVLKGQRQHCQIQGGWGPSQASPRPPPEEQDERPQGLAPPPPPGTSLCRGHEPSNTHRALRPQPCEASRSPAQVGAPSHLPGSRGG